MPDKINTCQFHSKLPKFTVDAFQANLLRGVSLSSSKLMSSIIIYVVKAPHHYKTWRRPEFDANRPLLAQILYGYVHEAGVL